MWHNFVCFLAEQIQGNFRRRKEIFDDCSCRGGVLEELDSAVHVTSSIHSFIQYSV
jgi:hypothetical protein